MRSGDPGRQDWLAVITSAILSTCPVPTTASASGQLTVPIPRAVALGKTTGDYELPARAGAAAWIQPWSGNLLHRFFRVLSIKPRVLTMMTSAFSSRLS